MTLLSALAGDPEIEALLSDAAQLDGLLAFERALAAAEADAGLIGADAASAVAAAIDGFAPDWDGLRAGMARDGVVVPELVQQLRAGVPDPHKGALHLGATSQDAIDTALMLALARIIPLLEARIVALQRQLEAMAAAHGGQALMAHTRMQAALPSTVGEKLRTWGEPLVRYLQGLAQARRSLLVVQLGGPVGDRTSLAGQGDAVARLLAQKLDLGVAPAWHSTRDPIVAFGGLLALISGSLGKIGADVALLAQSEVGAIRLSGGGGSSAMAHKSNPVRAEVLVSLARFNAGLSGTLQQAMVHENERSGAAWTLEWLVLPQMLVTAGASLRLAGELLGQVGWSSEP